MFKRALEVLRGCEICLEELGVPPVGHQDRDTALHLIQICKRVAALDVPPAEVPTRVESPQPATSNPSRAFSEDLRRYEHVKCSRCGNAEIVETSAGVVPMSAFVRSGWRHVYGTDAFCPHCASLPQGTNL